MKIMHFDYEYGENILGIDLILTGYSPMGYPAGWEVRIDPTMSLNNRWVVDDEPTVIVHPIVDSYEVGTVRTAIVAP